MREIHFFTKKFEFEIEVLVRSAWNGIAIEFVPVSVYYAPQAERISHFRPFKDFTRISILNTILVIMAVLYFRPGEFLRKLFVKKKIRSIIDEHLLNRNETDFQKSISISFGIFMGIIPIWGFQLVAAIFLAILLRLNKPLVIIAAHISIPPMIPLILFLSYKMGGFITGDSTSELLLSKDLTFDTIQHYGKQYFYGSIILAVLSALLFGILSYVFLNFFKKKVSLGNN